MSHGRIATAVKPSIFDNNPRRALLKPQWMIGIGFALAIFLGAGLLMLPLANTSGTWGNFLDALFTATSATCITGLSVVDIGTYFTLFGQMVILALIQLGGLGVMTFGTFLLILVGRRLSLQNEFVLQNSFGAEDVRGIRSLVRYALGMTLLLEGIGATILTSCYIEKGYDYSKAIYHGIFHAISAFCNAGFALYPDNLASFHNDPIYLLVIMALLVTGGLGFLVLHNLASIKFWRRNRMTRGRLSLQSRIVLTATFWLILSCWAILLAAEWHYGLQGRTLTDKLISTLFHSTAPRTAGFNVLDMYSLTEVSRFATMLMMFIGGSPGSTAGGVKTTTIVVLILTIIAMLRGRRETEMHGRTIPVTIVREALVIFMLCLLLILSSYGILLLTEHIPSGSNKAEQLMFETVSAVGTSGLSLGITPSLSAAGRLVIIVCMFIGRLGPLAAALIIGNTEVSQRLRYPEEEVVVG